MSDCLFRFCLRCQVWKLVFPWEHRCATCTAHLGAPAPAAVPARGYHVVA